MLLTERAIRQLIYNILLEGVREDADALRALLADAPDALRKFEPLSMKPKWVNWLADRYVRSKYPANDTLKDALSIVAAFAAADAAISQKYGSNPQFKTAVDTSFKPSERKWNNPADTAAMSTADMDTLLTIYRRPKDKLGIDREDVSWKNDEVGTFGPWKLYFPTNQQNSINIAGADPETHKPYTDWCTARTSGENLFNSYAAEGTMLFYAINTEATPEDPKSRISLGFLGGKLDVSGEFGGVTVDGANTGLTSSGLKRIFGGYYASIIARAEAVIAKHGGEHPVITDITAAAKDLDKFNSMLRGLGAAHAGDQAGIIFSKGRDVSPEVVVAAANHKYGSVRMVAAVQDRFPAEIILKLAGDPDVSVRVSIARRRVLPADIAAKLAEDPDVSVRSTIASRKDLPMDLILKLAGDSDVAVRRLLIRYRKDVPPDLIVKLAGDPDYSIRADIADRLDLPTSVAVKLAEDPDSRVRSGMAQRLNLPPDLVAKLAADSNAAIRSHIARRKELTVPLAIKLAADPVASVRADIAYRSNLPPNLVAKLAADPDDEVRREIANRSDLTEDILVKLAGDPSHRVQMAVAQRENLSQAAKDAINAARERIEESRHLAHGILREIKRAARS